jgi:phosphate transport system protein
MSHTFRAIDEELEALHREVAVMGELAVTQLVAAIDAFLRHDGEAAGLVAAQDARLDELDAEIERRAVRFIALRQPMADDLRAAIAAMKTAMNLERCGDLAKNMAKRTPQLRSSPEASLAQGIGDLGALVAKRLDEVVVAYKAFDAEAAKAVWEKDTDIDELHEKVFHQILESMSGDPSSIEASTHLLFMTKNLERIGDHATNIAELICYQATGGELIDRPKAS